MIDRLGADPVGGALPATLFTRFVTGPGAGSVIFTRSFSQKHLDGSPGTAAGVIAGFGIMLMLDVAPG